MPIGGGEIPRRKTAGREIDRRDERDRPRRRPAGAAPQPRSSPTPTANIAVPTARSNTPAGIVYFPPQRSTEAPATTANVAYE